ncbi:hypothetical protein F5882DRAFT_420439 [Hyaloscypha sp. PMI_1271]|nr:hypothetical protein F5882DRAFT_420439 [Hyaloscypha sp. PMI_1271]
MRYSSTLLFATSAVLVLSSPLPKPLNINMGAYSPALVVGDGAIGFKGTESVTNLMNTLQGAAANSAAANGAAAPAVAAPVAAEGTVAQDQQGAAVTQLLEGMGKSVVNSKRDPIDEDAYHLKALNAEIETRKMVRDTADDLVDEDLELDEVEDEYKRDIDDLEIEGEIEDEDVEKRDLTGFNAALNFATGALKSGPEVQLGTGEGGSGVGITQKAGGATTGNGTARVG